MFSYCDMIRYVIMVTSNVLQRVFHIRYGDSTATAFTVDIDSKQYFVTAKHVLPALKLNDYVELWHEEQWKRVETVLVGHHNHADISVFACNSYIEAHPMLASTDGLALGQDVFFMGFPLGLKSEAGEVNRYFPLPLVKKGCTSSLPLSEIGLSGAWYFYVDGYNNRGFSGGPVIFKKGFENSFNVCGVIHGYMNDIEDVQVIETGGKLRPIVYQNTGIMKVYSIENALDLIKTNPIGKALPTRL